MENFIIANCTDPGRTRPVNEDSMITFDSPNGRVVAVCDGMGGQNAGDVASQLAVTVIKDILTDNTFPSPEEAINRSIFAANQAILRRASQDPELGGMGATCVMLIIKDGQVYFGSVGDSRIYLVCNHSIRQLTKDQSYVQTLVDAGEITQEAAEHHQDKNQITNALGLENMTAPVICTTPIIPEPGSVFVLCSDGLSGMVNNKGIQSIVSRNNIPLDERARMLVQQANEAGGLDNITVQLVEFPGGAGVGSHAASLASVGSMAVDNGMAATPKKKKNVLPIVIIVIALVLAIAGAVYWYFAPKEKQAKPVPSTNTIIKKNIQQETPKENVEHKVVETVVVKETPNPKKAKQSTVGSKKTVDKILKKQNGDVQETKEEPVIMKKVNKKEELEDRIIQ